MGMESWSVDEANSLLIELKIWCGAYTMGAGYMSISNWQV
jgi:hypothetical protein